MSSLSKLLLVLGVLASFYCIEAKLNAYPGYLPKVLPSYCNEDPTKSTIVPLTLEEAGRVTSLKQVQVMIRHGARTPWGAEPCWKNYDVSWNDCNVTELMLASPTPYPYNSQAVPEPWLFRKIYDAFPSDLNGENCFTGQLLGKGYDQELENGRILRKQYLENANPAINLFPSTAWDTADEKDVYLRSDDEQRTLMSGQTLLSALFDVNSTAIVAWHTGDENLDQIAPNTEACPALTGAQSLAMASRKFQTVNNSAHIVGLSQQLDDILGAGYWTWYNVIDCFMTTVCTGREIPANQETGAVVTDEIFNATISQVEYTYAYNSNYNNSRFSRLGMGHTIYEMSSRMQAAINNEAGAIKFGLWSAHDTSIMPLLSAIMLRENGTNAWDGRWAQYAALFTIELYGTDGDDLFRMTYNGQPLILPGCDAALCDASALMDAMKFAQNEMPCEAFPTAAPGDSTPVASCGDATIDGMNKTDWSFLVASCTLLGCFFGAGCVVLYNRHMATAQKYVSLSADDNSLMHHNLIRSEVKHQYGDDKNTI